MGIWDRYTTVKEINSGGMARVHIAVDSYTGRGVAIKEILPKYFKNEDMRHRFKAEANDYLYLSHPGLIKLQNFIIEGSSLFIIMEYAEGVTLADFLKKLPTPMPFQNAAYLMMQVCDALHYIHGRGKVHLDVKPSNIMVNPENLSVKIIDLGISIDMRFETLKTPTGSPSYMSPEQISAGIILPQTDIFAIGITLFEMVMRRLPFTASSREQLFSAIKNTPTPLIKGYFQEDNANVMLMNAIVQKATQKYPQDRYASCELLRKDLSKIN